MINNSDNRYITTNTSNSTTVARFVCISINNDISVGIGSVFSKQDISISTAKVLQY